jgi:hypothetical protein
MRKHKKSPLIGGFCYSQNIACHFSLLESLLNAIILSDSLKTSGQTRDDTSRLGYTISSSDINEYVIILWLSHSKHIL